MDSQSSAGAPRHRRRRLFLATVEGDEDFASLRADPRFAALLGKIAATP